MPVSTNEVDKRKLEELNRKIAKAEQTRDKDAKEFFKELLSDELIFRRADTTVVGKDAFINDLNEPNPFTSRTAEEITVTRCGDRALVTLILHTEKSDGTQGRYRNIRVFFFAGDKWRLEVWYNYDLTSL